MFQVPTYHWLNLLRLRVTQEACNSLSYSFFFSSFSLPCLDRVTKVFYRQIVISFPPRMWPRSNLFPWKHLDKFSLSFYWLLFQAWVASTNLMFVWDFSQLIVKHLCLKVLFTVNIVQLKVIYNYSRQL